MLKAILLTGMIIAGALFQSKHLGTYYACQTASKGITQQLWLDKNDSFIYRVKGVTDIKGRYKVHGDSLFLLMRVMPLILHIKRNMLTAFNNHADEPEWSLSKIE